MASTLRSLPPSVLSLVTRLLPVGDLLCLTTLSGDKELALRCTAYGGVTELVASAVNEGFLLTSPDLPSFSMLTHLTLPPIINATPGVQSSFRSGWLRALPPTMLFLDLPDYFALWLRPLEVDDDICSVHFATVDLYTPVALSKLFPRLHTLRQSISGNPLPELQLLRLLQQLPPTLTWLDSNVAQDMHLLPLLSYLQSRQQHVRATTASKTF